LAETEKSAPIGLLLSDDLMFTSRIVGTARDLGLDLRAFKNADALVEASSQHHPTCVVMDLGIADSRIDDLVSRLRSSSTSVLRLVAYGSHVDTKTLQAARQAGCDPVLPRSKFVEVLPQSLREWMRDDSRT
jgi:CheY-like chemotaxis protein